MSDTPLPCPFCGAYPAVFPDDPGTEGNAWGLVACINPACVAQPDVEDGEAISDERGSDEYKRAAINRWNTRAPSPHDKEGEQ